MQERSRKLESFALVMAAGWCAVSLALFLRHKPGSPVSGGLSAAFLIIGLARPGLLAPIYGAWMKLAQVLAWVNTRLLLCVLYYGFMAPIGLIRRAMGKDPLKRTWDPHVDSYWIPADSPSAGCGRYEKQY